MLYNVVSSSCNIFKFTKMINRKIIFLKMFINTQEFTTKIKRYWMGPLYLISKYIQTFLMDTLSFFLIFI